MKVKSIQIRNYKCFRDSGVIHLDRRVTVVVGANNSGKSAFAEALSLQFDPQSAHRSLATKPSRATSVPPPRIEIEVEIWLEDLRQIADPEGFMLQIDVQSDPNQIMVDSAFISSRLSQREPIVLRYESEGAGKQLLSGRVDPTSYDRRGANGNWVSVGFTFSKSREIEFYEHGIIGSFVHEAIGQIILTNTYVFRAERPTKTRYRVETGETLRHDASNLGSVLGVLQSNPIRFRRFEELVRIVLPDIRAVSIRTLGDNENRVDIWSVDPKTEREDLAISLDQCGSGVAQVLAILYRAIDEAPSLIVIDEPQSFMHPGAVRRLLSILTDKRLIPTDHQYVFITHSPTVISAIAEATIVLITKEGEETKVADIQRGQTAEMRQVLGELGARLSDVFGADYVLWVEGATEEICFPLIVSSELPHLHPDVRILGVLRTGDFDKKLATKTFDLYERVSTAESIVPPAIGYLFDRDGRTETEISDLERKGKSRIRFLSRRMYENYLLEPSVLCPVIQSIFSTTSRELVPPTQEQLVDWIESKHMESKFFPPGETPTEQTWTTLVDGAKMLNAILSDFSNGTVFYEKVIYGPMLTQQALANSADSFSEIVAIIRGFFEPVKSEPPK